MILNLQTERDLPAAAKQFVEAMGERRVFAFHGGMGAGKTTFIQAILKEMGVESPDGSPTYSIINSYETEKYGAISHFDVYRLNDVSEALNIGMEDMLYDGGYCFIEWGEKVTEILPEGTVNVRISVNENGSRNIKTDN